MSREKASAAHQRRWPASLAVLLVLVSHFFMPEQVSVGPTWLFPALQACLLAPLVITNPVRLRRDHPVLRILAIISASGVMVVNAATLVHLVFLLIGQAKLASNSLLVTALILLVTNIVAASVVLWELDRGGPFARDPAHGRDETPPDLLFPQDTLKREAEWHPAFIDYLFVGFTMSTAFSPTDVLPLSGSAKVVFMMGCSVAISTFAIVAARAANIL